jgi:UDP-N-acetylmuramoyl-tripeptide--D-alanyl-D-alanine ligase
VLNADDERVYAFRERHPGRAITFGFSERANVRAEAVQFSAAGVRFRALGVDFEAQIAGRHGVMNLLAALAVSHALGIAPERLKEAVHSFSPGAMRGERMVHNGVTVWNDCYNSNPEAAQSMIDVLRETPAGKRIAVLGEMLELGEASEALHRQVGMYAAGKGIDLLIGVQGMAQAMVEAAAGAGLPATRFLHDPADAGQFARSEARPGDAVLFKGSRGVHIERALEVFVS